MLGCEGGAVATGRVDGSGPESAAGVACASAVGVVPGAEGGTEPEGCGVVGGNLEMVPLSRGVYSVVRDGAGWFGAIRDCQKARGSRMKLETYVVLTVLHLGSLSLVAFYCVVSHHESQYALHTTCLKSTERVGGSIMNSTSYTRLR